MALKMEQWVLSRNESELPFGGNKKWKGCVLIKFDDDTIGSGIKDEDSSFVMTSTAARFKRLNDGEISSAECYS